MKVPTYKSLYRPLTWGGIPRNAFILIIFGSMMSVMIFKNIKACLPLLLIYLIMLALIKVDAKILDILRRNLRLKDAYFPD